MARFREGTGISVVVALGSTAIYTLLAALIVVLIWIALSIYAIVEAIGDGRPSATAVLLIVVGLVGGLTVLAAAATWLIGRSLAPRRQRGGQGVGFTTIR